MEYEFKIPQYDHQVETFKFALLHPKCAVLSETGTGKTSPVVCSIDFRIRAKQVKKCLYVCPENIKFEIAKEIKKYCNRSVTVLHGTAKKKALLLKSKSDFYVINYDSLWPLREELKKRKFDAVICDESTYIKNATAKRSKAVYQISEKSKVKILVTGTPLTRDALDVFGQYRFLDRGIFGSLSRFKAEFCQYATAGGFPILVGHKNLDVLQDRIHSIAIRFRKDECLDLPDKVFVKRPFRLTGSSEIYENLKYNSIAELKTLDVIQAQNILTKIIKLSQVCSGFLINEERIPIDIGNEKFNELVDVLEESNLEETKVIIWCKFRHSIESLMRKLQKYGPTSLYGDTTNKQEALDKFRNDPTSKILVAQIQTGFGYTVNEATIAIYYETTHDLGHWLQSMDRNHRIGQTSKVTYITLVALNTIEESIYEALKNKQDLLNQVTKDNIDNIFSGLV